MNALLLMTSTFMVGADAPAAAPAAPAAVAGCSGCSDSCDPCAKKPGLLDKIKARLGSHKNSSCCEPAPTCCAPAPAPTCTPACDPCAARPNLLDKLKGKFGKKSKCAEAPCGGCDGCAAAPAPVPSAPATPPKPMDNKKASSDLEPIIIPSPGTLKVPSIPVVTGSKLTGAKSPY